MDEQDEYLDSAYEDRTYLPDEPNANSDFHADEYFDDNDLQSSAESDTMNDYYDDFNTSSQYGEFDEEKSDCQECGGMKEDEMMEDMSEYELSDEMSEDNTYMDEMYEEEQMCSECGSMLNEEGVCNECGMPKSMEEDMSEYDMMEEKHMCSECGSMLNEEGMCNECGMPRSMEEYMYESKKRTVVLKESELIDVIKKIVKESIPGLKAAEKSKKDSKKDNDDYYGEVAKKMKNYLQFEGNDNPEFPHQIGKGEKVARQNTPEEDDEVAKNFAGLENLDYDVEPSQKFKDRLKMAIEGDSTMGNGVYTEKPKIKPSNGADKGKEPKEKLGNQIKTKTAEKINKQVKNRKADKENRVIYKKENVPVDTKKNKKAINENQLPKTLLEEIQKMKKLSNYNDRTQ
jgi:ribosomal protein L37E